MGAFKPLLEFPRGRTVVEACIENLRGGGVEEIVVVVGHRAAEMSDALAHLGVRVALNAEAASEMSVSLERGASLVSETAESILVALADQPAIPPGAIGYILEARRRTGAPLIVPTWEGRGGHPVLLDARFRAALGRLDPRRGLRGLFEEHEAETLRLPVASPYVVRDMDTWEDYHALYGEIFGSAPAGLTVEASGRIA